MRFPIPIVLALVLAGPASAAGLSKYKDWAASPEAYFLSKAEREEWAKVDSDSAAEAFIAKYKSTRGGGFAAAIQSRIDYADKNFSVGKKKGSQTLRGRVLVVFGPPTRVDDSPGTTVGGHEKSDITGSQAIGDTSGGDRGAGGMTNQMSNVGGMGSESMRAIRPVETAPRTSRWIYEGRSVPRALNVTAMNLDFLIDPVKQTDQAKDPDAAKLEEKLQAVIEYWAPKAPAAK